MKGIIILEFDENDNPSISTQFPVNICEFLKVTNKMLHPLSEQHLANKMEPNYLEMKLNEDITVSSFYTGFSFRHYVGKPNYAVIVFLSEDDFLIDDFEGMMRRIAYELLPKREALNFDDIFGRYYEMLKSGELTPYWEEIIEGETSKIERVDIERKKKEITEKIENQEEEVKAKKAKEEDESISAITRELNELQEKNKELDSLVNEKSNKIRELTNKFTEVKSENTRLSTEIESLKKELSEQYVKLENWSQQMADLNEHNAKLMAENKEFSSQITQKLNELEQKENEIKQLKNKLSGFDKVGEEYEKIIQEKEELRAINRNLNSEIKNLEKMVGKLDTELEKVKNQNSTHIDTITSLKIQIKELKERLTTKQGDDGDLKNLILDLKKEIKVLRRERDHYMKIVKDNNLL